MGRKHKPNDFEPNMASLAMGIVASEAEKSVRLKTEALTSEDPEVVHDLRVCIRRIRSAIRILGKFLPANICEFDEPLHEMFERLGEVRDLDIASSDWTLHHTAGAAANGVQENLNASRTDKRLKLTVYLAKSDLLDRLLNASNSPSELNKSVSFTALEAPGVIRHAYRSVQKAAKQIGPSSSSEDIHRLRRRIKRLRYALEFFEIVYTKQASNFIEHLKELQDLLGTHQDSLATIRILQALPIQSQTEKRSLEMEISEEQRRDHKVRQKIYKAAGNVGDKHWKALQGRMRRLRRATCRE